MKPGGSLVSGASASHRHMIASVPQETLRGCLKTLPFTLSLSKGRGAVHGSTSSPRTVSSRLFRHPLTEPPLPLETLANSLSPRRRPSQIPLSPWERVGVRANRQRPFRGNRPFRRTGDTRYPRRGAGRARTTLRRPRVGASLVGPRGGGAGVDAVDVDNSQPTGDPPSTPTCRTRSGRSA